MPTNLTNIIKLMHTANKSIQHPKCLVQLSDGTIIRLTVATIRARYPRSVNIVSNTGFTNSKFYGRIHVDGNLKLAAAGFIGVKLHHDISEALQQFNANPQQGAKMYGHKTHHCCFCSRKLSRGESVTAGYGEVCADKYGLAYGNVDPEKLKKKVDIEKIMECMTVEAVDENKSRNRHATTVTEIMQEQLSLNLGRGH